MGNHCNSLEQHQGYEDATVESEKAGFKCWLYLFYTRHETLSKSYLISLSVIGEMGINDLFLRIIVLI